MSFTTFPDGCLGISAGRVKDEIFKHVTARVCENCGETYLDEEVTNRLLNAAAQAVQMGVQVAVREYVAA